MKIAIVVVAFKRPSHLFNVLDALQENNHNYPVKIFIDGARNQGEAALVRETVMVAKQFAYRQPYNVEISESSENLGLSKSIKQSIGKTFSEFEFVIVLEDDIVISHDFLPFMEKAAIEYKYKETVYQISGFSYFSIMSGSSKLSSHFSPFITSWGWGTWRDRWTVYDDNHDVWRDYFSSFTMRLRFDCLGGFYNQLLRNFNGELKTWAVFWYASVFKQNGLILYPNRSLVKNIGFDGSGENCGKDSFNFQVLDINNRKSQEITFPKKIKINLYFYLATIVYFAVRRLRSLAAKTIKSFIRIFRRS